MNEGRAYAKFYGGETARGDALPAWIHEYSHHRPHSTIGNQPPVSRLTSVPDHYTYASARGGRNLPLEDILMGAAPYIFVSAAIVLFSIFPETITWLPNLLY